MNGAREGVGPRWVAPLLLVLVFFSMMVCARPPEDGGFWRTGFVIASLGGFVALALAWRLDAVSKRNVLLFAFLFRFIVFPLAPVLSDDGFRYVWDGVVQVEAGINPYRYVPAAPELASLQGESIYSFINSKQYFSVYPPTSQFVFVIGGSLYPFGWLASWFMIKGVFALAEWVGLVLLSRLVTSRSLLLYAWNPLVVFEGAGQGHTEALAAPLLILAIFSSRRGRGALSAATVAAAGWVKLLPFVFLPFLVRRFGLRAALVGGAFTVALIAPYSAPYLLDHIGSSLNLYVRSFEFNAGLYEAVKGILFMLTGEDWSKQLGPALQLLFLLGVTGLFLRDSVQSISLTSVLCLVYGLFFVCATTVHPWYLLPLLALLPLLPASPTTALFQTAWLWISAFAMATYWRYTGPSWGYSAAVVLGWGGGGVLLSMSLAAHTLPSIMRGRARRKWTWIKKHYGPTAEPLRVLDLGAGDGYLGELIASETSAEVVLVDVVDFNQTDLPFVRYDGTNLPYGERKFDLTVLAYVLHHAADPEQVLREARRVTKGSIVVLESVSTNPLQHRLFEMLDRVANRIRSRGEMRAQEHHLSIQRDEAWRDMFNGVGLQLLSSDRRGLVVHRERLYLLKPLLD